MQKKTTTAKNSARMANIDQRKMQNEQQQQNGNNK